MHSVISIFTRHSRRPGPVSAAIAVVAAIVLAPASASADTEPNNSLPTAEGLVAGASYSGTVSIEDERDLYFFYAPGGAELKISTEPGSDCGGFTHSFTLEPALYLSGSLLTIDATAEVGPTKDATFVTPVGAAQIYYFRVDGGCEERYRFKIDSSLPFYPWPNPWSSQQPAPEPNESPVQAQGPLAGGITHVGGKTTVNDEDWFYFYARPSRLIEISMTAIAPEDGCHQATIGQSTEEYEVEVSSGGSWLRYGKATLQTAPGPIRKYFVKVSCPEGGSYLFNANPPDALSPVPASRPSRACGSARAKRRRLSRRLGRAIHNKHRARARRAKRRARRSVRKLRPRLRRVHRRMVKAC